MAKNNKTTADKELQLREALVKHYGQNAWDTFAKAYAKAKLLHDGQTRFSGDEYIIHPISVAITLAELGMDKNTVIAGLLHDTVEDTPYTKEELTADFGIDVANLVDAVTKIEKYEFSSSQEAQAENWRKMLVATAKDIRVIVIKLADRLDNLRTMEFMREDKQRQKAYETLEIFAPLAHRLGMFKMKWELEDLSLRFIDPVGYADLSKKVAYKRVEREQYVQSLISALKQKLDEAGIETQIEGRPKHFYSIYRKMYLQGKEFGQIYDLIALRVIVKTKMECYMAVGIVHDLWKPVLNRFKDYISTPKPNMYQSLHTTVIDARGEVFEVQIRTEEMHRVAEYGVAAHWKYKEGKDAAQSANDSFESLMLRLRELLEWQSEDHDAEDFINAVKEDLVVDEVLVFTPKGDLKSLPKGSTPIDFAYHVHSEVGNKCASAQVNGKQVPLNYTLQTGDVVSIRTLSMARPSRDWLNIVKSTQAREKIKAYFKKTNRDENVIRGKDMLERDAKRQGYLLSELVKKDALSNVLSRYSFKNPDDLYASVGYGGLTTNKVLFKLIEYYKEEQKNNPDAVLAEANLKGKKPSKSTCHGVYIPGVDNVMVRFANCCNPIPGDPIVGYITKGNGVSVHRLDCSNIASTENSDYRMVDVKWDDGYKGMFLSRVTVIADAGVNINKLSADITLMIADIGMELVIISLDRHKNVIKISVNLKNVDQLNNFINKIKAKQGVKNAFRTNE
ncbi:MAG: bifunctional (p)ppGpp synthetase/guanosine-3',5'-bis(diphosphate) 3'-pyrophosphohydrolase [Clostridiales bacterium]|nr:bifunctional (p)ppGpp synthetase/guanosine-3',5'-bis(diphosphate) 3'-pyrophosphohydrolase [Clostridiales bacterium]